MEFYHGSRNCFSRCPVRAGEVRAHHANISGFFAGSGKSDHQKVFPIKQGAWEALPIQQGDNEMTNKRCLILAIRLVFYSHVALGQRTNCSYITGGCVYNANLSTQCIGESAKQTTVTWKYDCNAVCHDTRSGGTAYSANPSNTGSQPLTGTGQCGGLNETPNAWVQCQPLASADSIINPPSTQYGSENTFNKTIVNRTP